MRALVQTTLTKFDNTDSEPSNLRSKKQNDDLTEKKSKSPSYNINEAVLNIIVANEVTEEFLVYLNKKEIDHFDTDSLKNSLFRGISSATKLMSTYFFVHESQYVKFFLRHLLAFIQLTTKQFKVRNSTLSFLPFISHISFFFKLDEEDVEKREKNVINFNSLMSRLVDPIFCSVDQFPIVARKVLKDTGEYLSTKVNEDSGQLLVGGFLFLRIINPTLTAPYRYISVQPNGEPFP